MLEIPASTAESYAMLRKANTELAAVPVSNMHLVVTTVKAMLMLPALVMLGMQVFVSGHPTVDDSNRNSNMYGDSNRGQT